MMVMNKHNNSSQTSPAAGDQGFTHDFIVIGAGPAGLSAAMTAASLGLRTVVLDEQKSVGGQIYRNTSSVPGSVSTVLGADYQHGKSLVSRFNESQIKFHGGTLVWDIAKDLTVTAQCEGKSFQLKAPQLLVATGALERPSPIPGWTLPGVMNAGAAQIAMKAGVQVPEGRIVLVGSGPLLLLVACQLHKFGASIEAIIETSPLSNLHQAMRHFSGIFGDLSLFRKGVGLLWYLRRKGIPFFKASTDIQIEGMTALDPSDSDQRVSSVSFRSGGKMHRFEVDVVLLHHGVVPNTQISRMLRVEHSWDEIQLAWHPMVNGWGETSLAGFRIAGDGVSIYGAAAAELSGSLAAIGAALSLARLNANEAAEMADPIRARLHRANRIRPFLDTLYRPPEWLLDCPDETIICRCEEVTAGRVREMARLGCQGPNQTKFFSRCGMGPCQGRMCGISVTQILAKELGRSPEDVGAYRIRAPIKPINLGSFATLNESQDPR